jgi:FlaA1/EpsC-like NDP-sugar epimerase
MSDLKTYYQDKTILVTGGCGSIGSQIVQKLVEYDPYSIRVLDNNETGLFDLKKELDTIKVRPLIGDVRDHNRLKKAMENVDVVFHTAALKHVSLCEYNPFEAVKTNILGTENVINASLEEEIEKLVFISTDKAVNPINVMGATKLLAERFTVSSNYFKGLKKTALSCVRFGNVLNSRGSVIPVFKKQIQNGGPVTVTDPEMTRFIMELSHAVELVLKSASISKGGEIFILKMPAIKIGTLAEAAIAYFAPKYGLDPGKISINKIGRKHGEKIHEELITTNEQDHIYEFDEMFIVLPSGDVINNLAEKISEKIMSNQYHRVDNIVYSSENAILIDKTEAIKLLESINN